MNPKRQALIQNILQWRGAPVFPLTFEAVFELKIGRAGKRGERVLATPLQMRWVQGDLGTPYHSALSIILSNVVLLSSKILPDLFSGPPLNGGGGATLHPESWPSFEILSLLRAKKSCPAGNFSLTQGEETISKLGHNSGCWLVTPWPCRGGCSSEKPCTLPFDPTHRDGKIHGPGLWDLDDDGGVVAQLLKGWGGRRDPVC